MRSVATHIADGFSFVKDKIDSFYIRMMMRKSKGIDGVIVVVGLCIIALVIIFVLKDQLAEFVKGIVNNMNGKATNVLDSASTVDINTTTTP